MGAAPEPVEKIMALDGAEFERSLEVLAPGARLDGNGKVTIDQDDGQVTIHFAALPPETLGGLLALPRARVTLAFANLDADAAAAFLDRFDLAFQRGGG